MLRVSWADPTWPTSSCRMRSLMDGRLGSRLLGEFCLENDGRAATREAYLDPRLTGTWLSRETTSRSRTLSSMRSRAEDSPSTPMDLMWGECRERFADENSRYRRTVCLYDHIPALPTSSSTGSPSPTETMRSRFSPERATSWSRMDSFRTTRME